jgi:hypothetical protein
MPTRRVGRQVVGPSQHSRLQPGVSTVGHLSGTATSLVMHWHHVVPLTECRVADDKTRYARDIEDIICYS